MTIALLIQVVTLSPIPDADEACTISGRIDWADGAALRVGVRRVERRWNGEAFEELLSDRRVRASAAIAGGSFTATLRAAAGIHEVEVGGYRERVLLLGASRALHVRAGDVRRINDAIRRAAGFLDDVEAQAAGRRAVSRGAFIGRVAEQERLAEELFQTTDLTATARELRDVFYELRNAQVWSREPRQGDVDNDGSAELFMKVGLTLDGMRGRIEALPRALSRELELSASQTLDERLRRQQWSRARTAAKATLELLTDASDRSFCETIRKAAELTEEQAPQIREALQARIKALVR